MTLTKERMVLLPCNISAMRRPIHAGSLTVSRGACAPMVNRSPSGLYPGLRSGVHYIDGLGVLVRQVKA